MQLDRPSDPTDPTEEVARAPRVAARPERADRRRRSELEDDWAIVPTAPDEGRIWLAWLVRLRWLALFAQAVTLSFVFRLLDGIPAIAVWAVIMGVLVVANLWTTGRMAMSEEVRPTSILVPQIRQVSVQCCNT